MLIKLVNPLAPPDRSRLRFTSLYQGGNLQKKPLLDKGGVGGGFTKKKKAPAEAKSFSL